MYRDKNKIVSATMTKIIVKLKTNYIYILIQVNYNIIVFYCCVVLCAEKSLNKNKSEIHIAFVFVLNDGTYIRRKTRTMSRKMARQNDFIYPISLPTSSSKLLRCCSLFKYTIYT